jgi:putative CocE/NonD family hydrolase
MQIANTPARPYPLRRRRSRLRHLTSGFVAALSLGAAACASDTSSSSDSPTPSSSAAAIGSPTLGESTAATGAARSPAATPRVEVAQRVAMRDGVTLATYVYLPDGPGPFPTLVLRTPYGLPLTPIGGYQDADSLEDTGRPDEEVGWPLITDAGFALVVQESRGTGGSGGANMLLTSEGPDGYDTVEWVADQAWSNGAIGIMGDSAAGMSAALAAAEQPPSLDALYTQNASHSLIDDLASPGGAVRLESIVGFGGGQALELGDEHFEAMGLQEDAFAAALERLGPEMGDLVGGVSKPVASGWAQLHRTALPDIVAALPAMRDFLAADPALRERLNTIGDITVPVLAVSTWHDVFARSTFRAALDAQTRGADFRLLAMPGSHYEIDEPSNWPITPMLDFFRETLTGGERTIGRFNWQAVGATDLETSTVWPPAGADRRVLRLGAGASGAGTLGAEAGTGRATVVSDPTDPIVTNAGMSLVAASGTGDDPSLAAAGRKDVVWFDAEPGDEVLRLRGPVQLDLDAAADAPSVDVSARLLAVAADGSSRLIRSAHVRSTAPAGTTRPLVIEFGDVAFDVPVGSQLRLELTGSDFPAWSLNPQNGDTDPLRPTTPAVASISIDRTTAELSITVR